MDHLRYAGKPANEQRRALEEIVRGEPILMDILRQLRQLKLPDWWVVSGVIYNNVWNHLTGRRTMTGVNDIDVFYYDPADTSYEAEDLVITRARPLVAHLPVPVQIRNQARVHLWYRDHFGRDCAPITSSRSAIDGFASKTHCVGVRLLDDDSLEVYAPYGLDDIFSFRITPNYVNDNRDTHEAKGARAKSVWPEIDVVPW